MINNNNNNNNNNDNNNNDNNSIMKITANTLKIILRPPDLPDQTTRPDDQTRRPDQTRRAIGRGSGLGVWPSLAWSGIPLFQ